jgi:hypothetical protein
LTVVTFDGVLPPVVSVLGGVGLPDGLGLKLLLPLL